MSPWQHQGGRSGQADYKWQQPKDTSIVTTSIWSQFCCSYLRFNHRPKRPWYTAASFLESFNKTSCLAFLLHFSLTLSCLRWQPKESVGTGHLLQLGELVHPWPGICVPHQVVHVDRDGFAWNFLSFRDHCMGCWSAQVWSINVNQWRLWIYCQQKLLFFDEETNISLIWHYAVWDINWVA